MTLKQLVEHLKKLQGAHDEETTYIELHSDGSWRIMRQYTGFLGEDELLSYGNSVRSILRPRKRKKNVRQKKEKRT